MSTLVERELTKETVIDVERQIFQLRYQIGDWGAVHLCEADAIAQKMPRPVDRQHYSFRVQKVRRYCTAANILSQLTSRKRKASGRYPDEDLVNASDTEEVSMRSNPFVFFRASGCKYQRPT